MATIHIWVAASGRMKQKSTRKRQINEFQINEFWVNQFRKRPMHSFD